MADTFLSNVIFTEVVLPFLLVFTIVFAVLQKTKLFGENQKRINALVALAVGIILVAFSYPTGIIVKLMPFLAVVLVILFVFMLLFGFVSGGDQGFTMPKGLKITFGILIGIALVIAVLVFTECSGGTCWDWLLNYVFEDVETNMVASGLFIVAIVVAMVVVLWNPGSSNTNH
ncbi:MAG: hypothetical protein ABIE22_04445 [archaeon]